MCVMYVWTIYMPNFKSIGSEMAFMWSKNFQNGKIFKFNFFLPKYTTQKNENGTIDFPVKFCIEKNSLSRHNNFEIIIFFTGSSNNHVLTSKLTFTLHLTFKT